MKLSRRGKSILVSTSIVFSSAILALLIAEVYFRVTDPAILLSPAYDYIDEIGIIPRPNVRMRHSMRGYQPFVYTTNQMRYRGELLPFDEPSKKVVVLGDSHSFGVGVNDGQTYAYVLDRILGDFRVVNLAAPGWGLSHQINRFVTLGHRYQPSIVILQFNANDPNDNLREPTVEWNERENRFVLRRLEPNDLTRVKSLMTKFHVLFDFLSGHSELYAKVKHPAYAFFRNLTRDGEASEEESPMIMEQPHDTLEGESYYIELLNQFVDYLGQSDVDVVMLSVQGRLELFPEIKREILRLDGEGKLTYLDTNLWFSQQFHSRYDLGPGFTHYWGRLSHRWIALKLAEWINRVHAGEEVDWYEMVRQADLASWCQEHACADSPGGETGGS